MVFPQDCSHFQHWIFSAEQLRQQRKQVLDAAIQRFTKQFQDKNVPVNDSLFLTQEESEYLVSYFVSQLLFVCSEKKLDYKITNTAVAFLSRFYLKRSVLEHDPRRILLTCLLLAIKVEDLSMSISLHHLCDGLISPKGVRLAAVIDSELGVLDALSFHLLVLQPRTAIHYLTNEYFQRYKASAAAKAATAEEKQAIIKAFSKLVSEINREAEQLALRTFENSDIPFEFTPSQIGIVCFLHVSEGRLTEAEKFVAIMFSGTEKGELFDSLRPKLLDLRTRLVLMTEARQREGIDERSHKALESVKKIEKLTKLLKGSNRKEKGNKKSRQQSASPAVSDLAGAEDVTAVEKRQEQQPMIIEEQEVRTLAAVTAASLEISTPTEQQLE